MRRAPDHRSERVSQVLYGHIVKQLEFRDTFALCESEDGYRGWIGSSYLVTADKPQSNLTVVTSNIAILDDQTGNGRLILPFGSLIASGGGDLFYAHDGAELILLFGRLDIIEHVPLNRIIAEGISLVSSPYLWGGCSSLGFDCSGFTQTLYRRVGVILPRDSKDQALVGTEVTLEESVAGDLIFFPGHVAILLTDRKILHASRLRGMVALESLAPNHPKFRSDLAGAITTVKRILQS